MAKKRKYKVFEVTTKSYGKALLFAGSRKSALLKAKKKRPSEDWSPTMTSHYDTGKKSKMKKKYKDWMI